MEVFDVFEDDELETILYSVYFYVSEKGEDDKLSKIMQKLEDIVNGIY